MDDLPTMQVCVDTIVLTRTGRAIVTTSVILVPEDRARSLVQFINGLPPEPLPMQATLVRKAWGAFDD